MGIYGDQRLNYVVRPRRSGQIVGWFLVVGFLIGLLVVGKLYLDKNQGTLDGLLSKIQSQYHALVTSSTNGVVSNNKVPRFNNEHMLVVKDLRFSVLEIATYFNDVGSKDYQLKFKNINADFANKMDLLVAGKNLAPLDDGITQDLSNIEKSWNQMGNEIRLMLENFPLRKKFSDAVASIHGISDDMVKLNNKFIKRLTTSKMSKSQFRLIIRQNYYLESIKTQSSLLISSGLDMSAPSERLGEDMTKLAKVYEGLLSGSRAYGVKRLRHSGLRRDVKKIVLQLKKLQEKISYIMDISPDIYEIRERQQRIHLSRNKLISDVDKLMRDYGKS